jgi:hypothetical protein
LREREREKGKGGRDGGMREKVGERQRKRGI